jgi:hypothetical protein
VKISKGALLPLIAVTLPAAACGARTGLRGSISLDASVMDAAPDVHDASAEPDVVEEDALEEDAAITDAFPDVPIVGDCPDAGETLVYLLGEKNELYSFYPPALTFKNIGTIACPDTKSSPNSMAVTRTGIAFTGFLDGNLYEVSTANAACKATPYVPDQLGWNTFGMGYAGNADGGETLYVAGNATIFAKGLGYIDTQSFTLQLISQFQPQAYNCELSGTSSGRLFGWCPFGTGSYLIEIDPATAKIIDSRQLSVGGSNLAFAFAFWGGDFWIFSSSSGPSKITRYDPVTQTETTMGTAALRVVGAGVSTCAPL